MTAKKSLSICILSAIMCIFPLASCGAKGGDQNAETMIIPKESCEDKAQPTVEPELVVDSSPQTAENDGDLSGGKITKSAEYFLSGESDQIRRCFEEIYGGLIDYKTEIDITDGVLESSSAGDLISMMTASSPDVSRLMNEYSLMLDGDGYVTSLTVGYELDKESSDLQCAQVKAEAEAICSQTEGMDDYEKVRYFHDVIISRCSYTYDGENVYDAYGCLVEGRAVCEGYSKAFMLLCETAGIQCIPVIGVCVSDGTEEPHMWNKVKLGGEWYNIDVTWDDPITQLGDDYVRYDYFNICDEDIAPDHTQQENRYMKYPNAAARDADYFIKSGLMAYSAEGAESILRSAAVSSVQKGDRYVRFKCSDTSVFDSTVAMIFGGDNENGSIFTLLGEVSELTGGAVSSGAYSVIKNRQTLCITVILTLN